MPSAGGEPYELVRVEHVQPGDRVLLPKIGFRVVLEVNLHNRIGMELTPSFWIVYALGSSLAFENRARAYGPVAVVQPEAGLRPMRPGELVAIAARPPDLRGLDDQDLEALGDRRGEDVDDAQVLLFPAAVDHRADGPVRPAELDSPERFTVDHHELEVRHPTEANR